MNPLVSVILTVYKRTTFLREALQSVLNQSFEDYEIIVADDSDSNEIKAITEEFKNSKILYKSNITNLGVTLSLKSAISESKGKYIAILNDDDAWEPDFLLKLSNALNQDENRVLAFCDHWIMDDDSKIDQVETDANTILYGRSVLSDGVVENPAQLVIEKNGIPLAMASMFRKDGLDLSKLVNEVSGAYDYWISCLLAASGNHVYYIPERLTRYRVHSQMETARKAHDKNENLVYIFQTLLKENMFPAMTSLLKEKYSQSLRSVAKDSLEFDQLDKSRTYFMRSLQASFSIKSFIGLGITFFPKMIRNKLRF